MIIAQAFALTFTLGDVVVAISVIGSISVSYYAMKAQIASFRSELNSQGARVERHSNSLKRHGRILDVHGRKIAGLEGQVFGRRIDDAVVAAAGGDDGG